MWSGMSSLGTLAFVVVACGIGGALHGGSRGASAVGAPLQAAPRDSAVTDTIGPQGGAVTLKGFATVTFPPAALSAGSPVRVGAVLQDSPTRAWFDAVTGDTLPVPLVRWEVRVSTGAVRPGQPVRVAVEPPAAWLQQLPAGWTPWLYARLVTGGSEEAQDDFSPVESHWSPGSSAVAATLAPDYFDDLRVERGVWYAVLVVGAVPPQ